MSGRRYLPPEAYGLVGDGRSAALVGRDGSVDWWCPPRFDAPSVFARLLDDRIGGFCSLGPAGAVHDSPLWESSQRYRPGTAVLVTEFRGADARLEVTDFMPWPGPGGGDPPGREGGAARSEGDRRSAPRSARRAGPAGRNGRPAPTLLRRVKADGGPVQAELRFAPRFDYARRQPEYREREGGWAAAGGEGEALALAAGPGVPPESLEPDGRRGEVSGRFRVEPGEPRWIALRWGGGDPRPPGADAARRALEETAGRWRRRARELPPWARRRESVARSALLLDLLTHAPTGAVVEAPTTSLPGSATPAPGRDGRALPRPGPAATAVLSALVGLGRRREARRLGRRLAEARRRRLRGDIPGDRDRGRRERPEPERLDHLHGHRGHRPVRVGADRPAAPAAAGPFRLGPADPDGAGADGGPPPLPGTAEAFEEARALALEGRPEAAEEAFERAAARAGPTGLLAGAFDPASGELRGDYPSAPAHASLLDAARVIAARRRSGPVRRTSTPSP